MTQTVLHIDTSARHNGSYSRDLTRAVVDRLAPDTVVTRDLTNTIPLITETWIGASFTDPQERTPEQHEALAISDELVAEVQAADTLVIGVAMYNFSIPAALKAWIDQVARAGVTFRYTESGPVGLLEGKRAILVIASGGVPVGSDYDFATDYMRHVLGFIGIRDVDVVAAAQLNSNADEVMQSANAAVAELAA